MTPRDLRRAFLWSFVGCLAFTALVAIVTVLSGDFGETQARVLASSGAVSAASVCAMACAAFRERGRVPQLGTLGIVLAGIALVATLVTVWQEAPDDGLIKTALVLSIWAVAVAHAELLLLPVLAVRHRPVQVAAVVAIATLAALLTVLIVGELSGNAFARLLGVVSIVVALLTLVVPIVARIGGEARVAQDTPGRLVLQRGPDGVWVDASGARYAVTPLEHA